MALVVVISLFVRAAGCSRGYYAMTLSIIPPTMDIIVVSDFSLYNDAWTCIQSYVQFVTFNLAGLNFTAFRVGRRGDWLGRHFLVRAHRW